MTTIYNNPTWFVKSFDGRRKEFRGISREQFETAKRKHMERTEEKHREYPTRVQEVSRTLRYFNTIPYEYEGDGLDDYNSFQRPASNGEGYVAICPGESGNNVYVDDPIAVKILTRKYNDWKASRG